MHFLVAYVSATLLGLVLIMYFRAEIMRFSFSQNAPESRDFVLSLLNLPGNNL